MKVPLQRCLRIILAAILMVVALAALGRTLFFKSARPKNMVYFYNEKTKTLFAASDQLLPPIDTDSGPGTGVRAYVFTAGDPKDESKRVIAYLEKMTPEARDAATADLKTNTAPLGFIMQHYQNSMLVRRPDDSIWYPRHSPQGQSVMKAGREATGVSRPALCLP